jgi:hypothetical protein
MRDRSLNSRAHQNFVNEKSIMWWETIDGKQKYSEFPEARVNTLLVVSKAGGGGWSAFWHARKHLGRGQRWPRFLLNGSKTIQEITRLAPFVEVSRCCNMLGSSDPHLARKGRV